MSNDSGRPAYSGNSADRMGGCLGAQDGRASSQQGAASKTHPKPGRRDVKTQAPQATRSVARRPGGKSRAGDESFALVPTWHTSSTMSTWGDAEEREEERRRRNQHLQSDADDRKRMEDQSASFYNQNVLAMVLLQQGAEDNPASHHSDLGQHGHQPASASDLSSSPSSSSSDSSSSSSSDSSSSSSSSSD